MSTCHVKWGIRVRRGLAVCTLTMFGTMFGTLSNAQQVVGPPVELPSVTESLSDCPDHDLPGTLFQWSGSDGVEGGPDLSEPLVTDRPDFTEASSTVGLRVAQLEFGYTYFFDNDGTQSIVHTYPETLLRYGILAEWLELRVGWTYLTEQVSGLRTSGAEDLYLGFKIGLTPQEHLLPEMAIIPQVFVPAGSDAFTSNQWNAGLNWIYSWEINDCISTAGSTQFNRAVEDATGESFTVWAQSWTIAYSLTDRLGGYTEWFGLMPTGADQAKPEYFFNGGFTYLFNDNVQWDIRAGVGLNDPAIDYFVGTGMSIRCSPRGRCNLGCE